jgi:hypothetical protein
MRGYCTWTQLNHLIRKYSLSNVPNIGGSQNDRIQTQDGQSFHQENLDSAAEREEMKLHWEEVLQRLTEIDTELGG